MKKKNEAEVCCSDVSSTVDIERNEWEQRKREEAIESIICQSYFANVQPRIPIRRKHEDEEESETGTPNEKRARHNIRKRRTSRGSKDKRKSGRDSPDSTTPGNTSKENCESSCWGVVPDSQVALNISPVTSTSVARTDRRDGSVSSSSSSTKGIRDSSEAQPKICAGKGVGPWEKTSGEERIAESRVRTRASAKREALQLLGRKATDEEPGTVTREKRISRRKKRGKRKGTRKRGKAEGAAMKLSERILKAMYPLNGTYRDMLFALKVSRLIPVIDDRSHPLFRRFADHVKDTPELLEEDKYKFLVEYL